MTYRAGIVMRVSTDEQNPENQRARIEGFLKSRPDIEAVEWYVFKESAYKVGRKDPEWNRMWADAERHHINMVLCLRMDRFSRNTVLGQFIELNRLETSGVKFHSIDEPFLSTDNEFSPVLRAIIAYISHKESEDKGKRVKEAYANRTQEWGRKKGSGEWAGLTELTIRIAQEELIKEGKKPSLRNIGKKLEKWDSKKGKHISPSPATILRLMNKCFKKGTPDLTGAESEKSGVAQREPLTQQKKGEQ